MRFINSGLEVCNCNAYFRLLWRIDFSQSSEVKFVQGKNLFLVECTFVKLVNLMNEKGCDICIFLSA